MGLASAHALARAGAEVTVLERFDVINDRASHGGFTRIIRQAYHEGSGYVSLIRQAEAHWLALGERVEDQLLVRTGLLEFGPADHPELIAATAVCESEGIDHEITDAATAMRRWPITVPKDWATCFTPSGGYLRVVACMTALRKECDEAGVRIRPRTRVEALDVGGSQIGVRIAGGEMLRADRLVVTAGAWLPELLGSQTPAGVVRLRRVLAWTRPQDRARPRLSSFPVWGAFLRHGFFYGFPYGDEGVDGFKVACHTNALEGHTGPLGEPIDPDTLRRSVSAHDLQPLRDVLEAHIPSAVGPWAHHTVCMYTATPSWDFLVDRLPTDPRVVVAGGFSGHGFKFAPAIGSLVAALVSSDAAPLADFSFARHGSGACDRSR